MLNGIRMVFQELSLIPTMTVMENIFLNHEELSWGVLLNKKAMIFKTKQLLEELGIDLRPDQKIAELSVGYCQLVEIAKVALRQSLDPRHGRADCLAYLRGNSIAFRYHQGAQI